MAEREEKKIIVKVAYNYFQAGNWDRALDEYKKLIAIDPMDFLVHNMLAEIFFRKGDKDEAVREYMHAASLLRATNSMEKALMAYNRILKLEPQHREALVKIEEVVRTRIVEIDEFLRRGAFKQAEEICERLLERLPEHPLVLEKSAEIARRQQEQPLLPIERAVRKPENEPKVAMPAGFEEVFKREELVKNLYTMADLYESKQSWDEAVEAYITILRFLPEDENARIKLHALYRKVTRQDKAAEVWARINAEDKKRLEQAKRLAHETKLAAPAGVKKPVPSVDMSQNLAEMEKLRSKAEAKLRRAVEDRRERDKSKVENEGLDSSDAQTSSDSALPPEQDISVLQTQAHMYTQQNMLIEAMRLCQRILEMDPQNRDVRGLLQKIFERKKL